MFVLLRCLTFYFEDSMGLLALPLTLLVGRLEDIRPPQNLLGCTCVS